MTGRRLSGQERALIWTLHRQGVAAKQIAERSGRPLRTVYDVLKQADQMMRRCSACGQFKPADRAFYQDRGRHMAVCKECHKRRVRERERRLKENPLTREKFLADRRRREKEWRARNPDRVRAARAASYERLRADPDRWQARLEDQRINYWLRLERAGKPLGQERAEPEVYQGNRLPVGPFRRRVLDPAYREARYVLDADRPGAPSAAGSVEQYVAHLLGTSERRLWEWRNGGYVSAELAERAWTELGLNWFDVYSPGDEGYERACALFGEEAA